MRALMLSALLCTGCVTPMRNCPTAEAEPVSVCRARAACHVGSAGSVFGAMLSGAGAGGGGRNMAVRRQNDCIDQDLEAQRYDAGFEQPIKIKCESTTYNDGTETVCKQN